MKRQWYCWIEGQQYGPAEVSDLLGWVKEGRLHAGDYVWSEGMAEWTVARNIPDLFPSAVGAVVPRPVGLAGAAMPPLPQAQVSYPGKGMCVAGMVLGIASIVSLCCWCAYGLPSIICGLVGLILSIVGSRQAKRAGGSTGMGLTGIVLSAIGLALGLIAVIILVSIAVSGPGSFEDLGLDLDAM